jgi:AcrR family transcriptional regulator
MKTPRTPELLGAEQSNPTSVRERLLDTAADLFYREGIRAVGVDLVVKSTGVAKTSLYRHFPSKDDLVAAVLERDDRNYWANWERIAQRLERDPGAEISAHVLCIAKYIGRAEFRGCAFLNAATEFPSANHPARKVALRHKSELRRRLGTLTMRLGVQEPGELADQLVLLIDGAYVNGQLRGKRGPIQALSAAAAALIEAAMAAELPALGRAVKQSA